MKTYALVLFGVAIIGSARASIFFQAEPPAAPATLPAVQLAPVRISEFGLMNRAADFGVKEGRLRRTPRGLLLEVGSILIALDPLGSEFFADTSRYMAETPGEADPLPDTEVMRLADAFMSKTPGRVNPAEISFGKVRHLRNQGEDILKGTQTPITQDESFVLIGRQFKGIPVIPMDGTSEHVRLHFDNKGVLTGEHMAWRNAQLSDKKFNILPYADVRDAFVRRLTLEMGNAANDAYVVGIEFGYFGRPEGQPQGWFQPAYLFTVQIMNLEMKEISAARKIAMPAISPQDMLEPLELPSPPSEVGDLSRVSFKATPPQLPGSAPIFPIMPNPVTSESILIRGRELGIQGTPTPTPRGFLLTDGRLVLAQDPAGSEVFGDTARMMNEDPGAVPPLTDAEVLRFAGDWLKAQGIDSADLGPPIVRRLKQQTFDTVNQKLGEPTSDEAIVEFPRLLHTATGAPLMTIGEGAFVKVHVDNKGVVTGHHKLWRNVGQPLRNAELRPYAGIQDEFLRRLQSELGQSMAEVTGISFGMYFRPEGVAQGFAQPAVLFDVDIRDDTGDVTAHRQIPVPATPDIQEPLDDPDASLVPDNPGPESSKDADGIPVRFGDVNGDTNVDVLDVAMVLRAAGGVIGSLAPEAVTAGDVTPTGFPGGDGQLQLTDALRILRSIYSLDNITNGPQV